MKKLITITVIAVTTACSQHAGRSAQQITGAYERVFKHEFGTLQQTIIITPSAAGVLQFEVRELSRHLDTAIGMKERKQPTEKHYHGKYDPAQRMLDLGNDGLKYYFNANGDTLRSGNNIFLKRS